MQLTHEQQQQAAAKLSESEIQLLTAFREGDATESQVLGIIQKAYPNRDEETDFIQLSFDAEWMVSTHQRIASATSVVSVTCGEKIEMVNLWNDLDYALSGSDSDVPGIANLRLEESEEFQIMVFADSQMATLKQAVQAVLAAFYTHSTAPAIVELTAN